jgi:ABC-type hemin transport system substrate-binding protein
MQLPRPESRLSALEALTSLHTARIKEIEVDTSENFREIKHDIKQLGEHVDLGFRQAHAYIQENIESRLDRIEAAMATKDDIAALKTAQIEQAQKLDQLLQLLQQKPSE